MHIEAIDHLVLTVKDISATLDFYSCVLGMEIVTFGAGRHALRFGHQKINLHEQGCELEPKAVRPTPGSADLCFVTQTPLTEVIAQLTRYGIVLVDGPVTRTGAIGPILSVYLRDPDLNLIELSNYLTSGEKQP